MELLKVQNLSKSFGGLMVITQLSFSLFEGEILGVIGPNGSGKTTLFNLITGFLSADQGSIQYMGKEITNKRPSEVCKLGIGRTFQIAKPFSQLTVLENVMAGRAYGSSPAKDLSQAREEAFEILRLVKLDKKWDMTSSQINLIDRKRLEVARAMATKPKLLLLDEVFAGLNPKETEEALELVDTIKKLGITMMVVEHVIKVILSVSNRVIVISSGNKIFEGSPQDAVNDQRVIEAYLGEEYYA